MCSAGKLARSAPAREIYTSRRYTLDRDFAEETFEEWRILSGRYGVLAPTAAIRPYDCDLESSSWAIRVFWMLRVTIQLALELGFREPAIVCLMARGAYRRGTEVALRALAFRCKPEVAYGQRCPALWTRGTVHEH
jgi:Family of unknown function (DUF6884)